MARLLVLLSFASGLVACSETAYYAPASVPETADPPPSAPPRAPDVEPSHVPSVRAPLSPSAARITVYEGKTSPKPGVVVGIIDVHTDATRSEEGFDELRRRATALGADCVIGADFHHGDENEPSHVSGMAIRYRDREELPYDLLGKIDVTSESSDSNAQATALEELKRRGQALGADEIIDVEFHHADEKGEASHLTGTAIRHRAKTRW